MIHKCSKPTRKNIINKHSSKFIEPKFLEKFKQSFYFVYYRILLYSCKLMIPKYL